jgi:16S rRNA (cytosine967-C5)-methyltransferase
VSEAAVTVLTQSALALDRVIHAGRSADTVLGGSKPASAAVRAVTLGSLRWYGRLDALLKALLAATRVVPRVRALLLVALHQLEYSRTAPELVVSIAVDAVRALGQPRASGLVNALLRRYLRERDKLIARALQDEASAQAHPRWLWQALQQHWPEQWREIVAANNGHPPMSLRVNLARRSRADYLTLLEAAGLGATPVAWSSTALMLERPVPVQELPGFADGLVSIQDAGAQLASVLLDARSGERVLDACAAPGGKTGAILEAAGGPLDMVAVDVDETRLLRVEENLTRLQFSAQRIRADLTQPASWWDGRLFDRILVDAPCSSTGVLRRHPDIKVLRRPTDIDGFVVAQGRILRHCLPMLRQGGRLLYSTCSVLPQENERLVAGVLTEFPAVRLSPWPADVALPPQAQRRDVGVQLLPTDAAQTDGFYYACLTSS